MATMLTEHGPCSAATELPSDTSASQLTQGNGERQRAARPPRQMSHIRQEAQGDGFKGKWAILVSSPSRFEPGASPCMHLLLFGVCCKNTSAGIEIEGRVVKESKF